MNETFTPDELRDWLVTLVINTPVSHRKISNALLTEWDRRDEVEKASMRLIAAVEADPLAQAFFNGPVGGVR
jgi:hypothetical protein